MLKLREAGPMRKRKIKFFVHLKLVCHYIGHIDFAPVLDIYLCFIWA
jgi:hypothetical protein